LIEFKCFQKTKSDYWVFLISVGSPGSPHRAGCFSPLNFRDYSHFLLVLRYLCMSPFGLKLDKKSSTSHEDLYAFMMRFRYWFSLFETVFYVTYRLGLEEQLKVETLQSRIFCWNQPVCYSLKLTKCRL